MDEETLKRLDVAVMEIIEENNQRLYADIMERMMQVLDDYTPTGTDEPQVVDFTATIADGPEVETIEGSMTTTEDVPEPASALEMAMQSEEFNINTEDDTPAPGTDIPTAHSDLKGINLVDKDGINENTKGNMQSLQEISRLQMKRDLNQTKRPLPTPEKRQQHILKIIDQKFARQTPLPCDQVKGTVLSYKLLDDAEYEDTMKEFIKDGMARLVNGKSWFFMASLPPGPASPEGQAQPDLPPELQRLVGKPKPQEQPQAVDEEAVEEVEEEQPVADEPPREVQKLRW